MVKHFSGDRECVARRGFLLGIPLLPGWPGFRRQYARQAHRAAFLRAARQRRVFGLTMAAEVSVHFPARPFGPCGSSRAGGKAVR